MSIKVVLFDLDGTLLPMDLDTFTGFYFKALAAKLAPLGYEPEALIKNIWAGTAAMVKNDGSRTNEEAFWAFFCSVYGAEAQEHAPYFEAYYQNEFQNARAVCGFAPKAAAVVHLLKNAGMRVALATNPFFPAIATESRIRWAGMEPEDFELYTTYETYHYCKPNLRYYEEVCKQLGVSPSDCLMVGNDVGEDMIAQQLGMRVFLLTDCLINKNNADLSAYPHGDFDALESYLKDILKERDNGCK